MVAWLFGSFVVLLLIGAPIAASLGLSAVVTFVATGMRGNLVFVVQQMFSGMTSYQLMAIPLFILCGNLMTDGGLSRTLVNFINLFFRRVKGSLAYVTIAASAFFAALSGSSPATTAAIGGVMAPEMEKTGYSEEFSLATAAAAGTLGQIIPPSVGMVSYAVLAEVSVGTLFLTGFGPGIVMALAMMVYAFIYVKKNNIPASKEKISFKEALKIIGKSIPALIMPLIILGGIYSGLFTPTESGAIASVYGLLCGLFITRSIKFKDLPRIFVNTAVGAGTIMLVLGSVQVFCFVLTRGHIPQIISETLLGITNNKYILLLLFNVILLIAGMFLNAVSAIALFTPILLPVLTAVGISPYMIGIIKIVNLGIGLITPPVGNCLFVACGRSKKLSFEQVSKACVPYIIALAVSLLLITYVEPISMGLIWLTGAKGI
ncbi:MAG: TRAP transporter large permease [Clostridia bacterium]|nr:TRAP transporter large permease [Clostridia bacterium]